MEKYCSAGQATDDKTIRRIACWIRRTTYKHSEFVILIPFPLQKQLHESSLKLRYTYIACLVRNGIYEKSDLVHVAPGIEFCHQVKSTTWTHRRLKLLEKSITLFVFLTVRWTYQDLLQITHPSHEITTKGMYFVTVNNSAVPQLRLLFARFHSSTTRMGFMVAKRHRPRFHFRILLFAVCRTSFPPFLFPPFSVFIYYYPWGTGVWGGVVVKALRYWSDGSGIDSQLCHWIFQ